MIYCDHAATTPIDNRVVKYMCELEQTHWGNPNSVHDLGLKANKLIQDSEKIVLDAIEKDNGRIFWTQSASAANKLLYKLCKSNEMNYSSTETSHKSAYNLINTNVKGLSLFSIETINHETGRYNIVSNQPEKAFYHADNVQGFLKMNMPLHMYDAITLSSHKIYGPKGIGCLWVSNKLLDHFPNIDFYNGTLSPVLIRGFAKAIEVYDKTPKPYVNEFLSSLQLNYISFGYNIESQNLSYISSISFPEVKAVDLLMELNARGVYASQGSACNKGKFDTRILRSSGYSQDDWNSTVRFSFGKLNENTDFRELAKIIKDSINAAKN